MDFLTVEWLSGFAAGMVAYAAIDAFVFPRLAHRWASVIRSRRVRFR